MLQSRMYTSVLALCTFKVASVYAAAASGSGVPMTNYRASWIYELTAIMLKEYDDGLGNRDFWCCRCLW